MKRLNLPSIAFTLCVLAATMPFLATGSSSQTNAAEIAAQERPAAVFEHTTTRAINYLRRAQNEDGSFSPELGPAITALVTTALLRHDIPERDPVVAKGLRYIEQFVRDDGGIYQEESIYRNYETSLAILCFSEVKESRFQDYVKRAEGFVRGVQWNGDDGHDLSSPSFGGAGYGKHKRPDLSNTSIYIEALKAMGFDKDDEALQNALVFVSRGQNLESQHNTLPFSNKIGDGGFYYTPAAGGSSQAGVTENGGLRSYGSMTYAGLKSMIYAGLEKDDPRVRAASDWIRRNYDLTQNPGMLKKHEGLFYYYHTFAKALDALGERTITDNAGVAHDWRAELLTELAKRQNPKGWWVNKTPRWLEGDTELVTAYALLSLSYCKP